MHSIHVKISKDKLHPLSHKYNDVYITSESLPNSPPKDYVKVSTDYFGGKRYKVTSKTANMKLAHSVLLMTK